MVLIRPVVGSLAWSFVGSLCRSLAAWRRGAARATALGVAALAVVALGLIPDAARAKRCGARWRELLGDHAICMESPRDAAEPGPVAAALLVALGLWISSRLVAMPSMLVVVAWT